MEHALARAPERYIAVARPETRSFVEIGHQELGRNRVFALDGECVLKVYGAKSHWERERRALALLRGRNLPTPSLISCGNDEDAPWIAMSMLEGSPLSSKPPTERAALLFELGRHQAAIHRACPLDAREGQNKASNPSRNHKSFGDALLVRSRKYFRAISEDAAHAGEAMQLFRRCLVLLEHAADALPALPQSRVFCHNDFDPRNILVKRSSGHLEITGMIDFEQSSFCEREHDLTRILFDEDPPYAQSSYLKGYESASSHRVDFDKLTCCMMAKCLDVCSWARKKAPGYYRAALDVLARLVAEAG